VTAAPPAWRRELRLPGREDAWAVGGLAALVALLFNAIVFRGRVLYERDIHLVWHAQVESFVRCIASGSWPVWDPYLSFGRPLLANPATQAAYPWTWLNLVAPPAPIYTAYVVAHLVLAGAGAFRLARRMDLSASAAFVGAATWTLSGPLLSMVSVWHHLAGAAWMPWVVLAAECALRSPSVGRALLWGGAFGAQMLAGSPDMCVMTGAVVGVQVLASFARGSARGAPVRTLACSLLALGFALGLAAVLWMPAVENARHTGRWEMAESARTVWSMHPASLLQVLLPLLPGDVPLSLSARTALFDVPLVPFVNSFHLGLPALALAAAAFAGPRPPWALGFLALAATVVALGRHTWMYAAAAQVLPPMRILRYPSKAMVPAAFAVALLCAWGFEAWSQAEAARRRRWLLVVALPATIGCAVTWSALYLALHPEAWSGGVLEPARAGLAPVPGPAVRKLAATAAVSAIVLALAAATATWPRLARPAATAVAALAVGGLLWAHWDLNPTAPAAFYRERPPIVDLLEGDGARRVYVFDYLSRVTGKAYRNRIPADIFSAGPSSALDAARGLQHYLIPITASRWGLFGSYEADLYALYSPQLRSLTLVARAAEETPLFDRLLRIGAVDHVVALHEEGLETLDPVATLPSPFAAPIRVFRVPGAWPRSYVVAGARVGDGPQAWRILADPAFDPAREVVLSSGAEIPPVGEPVGGSRILELRHDRVRVEAELRQPGFLVLSDTYDPGWKATVDGRAAPIQRANGAFRALRLEAGRHLVEMVYRPSSVMAGAALSALSLLAGCAAAAARFVVGR
jgi:membrane protein YfhO